MIIIHFYSARISYQEDGGSRESSRNGIFGQKSENDYPITMQSRSRAKDRCTDRKVAFSVNGNAHAKTSPIRFFLLAGKRPGELVFRFRLAVNGYVRCSLCDVDDEATRALQEDSLLR